jgi:hypothetical protein
MVARRGKAWADQGLWLPDPGLKATSASEDADPSASHHRRVAIGFSDSVKNGWRGPHCDTRLVGA